MDLRGQWGPEALHAARDAFGAIAELASAMTGHLALASADRGQLDEARLDLRQADAFWLATTLSRLQAARSILGFARRRETPVAIGAAEIFVAELVQAFATELAFKAPLWGIPMELVETVWKRDGIRAFGLGALAPHRYEQLGDLVLAGGTLEAGLDPERDAVRQQFRQFADTAIAPLAAKVHNEDGLVPPELREALGALGCFGMSIPAAFGGLQPDDRADHVSMCLITEELSRAALGMAGSLVTRPEVLSKALLKGGTDEQKEHWLPLIARGAKLAAIAVTEPGHGSDVAAVNLAASPVDDGWLLDGKKTWCTFAGAADVLMVLARSDQDPKKGHRGLTLFLVEKPRFEGRHFEWQQPAHGEIPGGTIRGAAIPTIGHRGMYAFAVDFERFFVPEHAAVGGLAGIGKGFYYQMEGFAAGRLQTAARATGVMQAAIEAALAHAKSRRVFGVSIANFGLTRWKLAKMAIAAHATRQFTFDTAGLLDAGKGQLEASMAKLWASREAEWVTREAMQIFGGAGYAEASDVARYFVDARVLSLLEGTDEVLALKVVARQVLQRWLDARREAAS